MTHSHWKGLLGGLVLSAATLAAGAQVVVRMGPPPPHEVEVVPAVPTEHPSWVWQPGYQRWNGTAYEWHAGEYAEPPYQHARWVPGHWAHRHGGYVWVEGHWKRH